MNETHGVIVIVNKRCVFASTPLSKDEAEALAPTVEGDVVDVTTLRQWKQQMVNGDKA